MFTVEQHLLLSVILFFALLVLLYIVTNVSMHVGDILQKGKKSRESTTKLKIF